MSSCIRHLMNTILCGALGGALATAMLNAVVVAARSLGLFQAPTPLQPASCAEDADPGDQAPLPLAFQAGWLSAHVLYGMGCGVLFSLFSRYAVRPLAPRVAGLPLGVGFGLVIWGASARGLLPEMRLSVWPGADTRGRLATMIAAHAVFGMVLGAVEARCGRGTR